MQLSPFQLGALVVGSFATIVGLNILAKYRSNEDFRTQLSSISPTDLLSIRSKRVAEERMEPVAANFSEGDETDDES